MKSLIRTSRYRSRTTLQPTRCAGQRQHVALAASRALNLNLSATWDPYLPAQCVRRAGARRRAAWKAHKGWVKLSSCGDFPFSYTLNNSTFKRKKKSSSTDTKRPKLPPTTIWTRWTTERADRTTRKRRQSGAWRRICPLEFSVSLTLNYSVNYSYGEFDKRRWIIAENSSEP